PPLSVALPARRLRVAVVHVPHPPAALFSFAFPVPHLPVPPPLPFAALFRSVVVLPAVEQVVVAPPLLQVDLPARRLAVAVVHDHHPAAAVFTRALPEHHLVVPQPQEVADGVPVVVVLPAVEHVVVSPPLLQV